ncbi:MAG: TIGR02206 family membrane protein [Candidatus Cohnella colombiensis]|uniref:TIGR02206 family membrane protein n=1 Tax=Candidatus Cohnella colombiensis TaxID=3121368 RepID=A0AA95EZ06_9BACL|nr:MAG: TIGR02206 family membrane protein [Cohnella sp.]
MKLRSGHNLLSRRGNEMAFVPFGIAHVIGILLSVVMVFVIIHRRQWLRKTNVDRIARYSLAGLLIGCEVSLYIWYEVTDNWGLHSLPFQLCSIMMWLSAALLLTRNHRLYEIGYFLGILGAIQAILTPNLDASYPEFRYFHFFIAHAAIIAASVYMTAVHQHRPKLRSMFRALGWLHVLALPAAITNWITGSNFMFLARKPDTGSLLDLLSPWPWYLLQLELVAMLLCFMLYGIVWFVDRMSSRMTQATTP